MATYYVRPDGNNANTGLGSTTGLAWQTIGKALGASGISSGDTVYIAPGSYNESITVGMTSATATTSIIGDPTASQFSGLSAGPVTLTAYTVAGTVSSTVLLTATTKNYLSFQNIYFDGGTVTFTTSTNISFSNCQFAMGYVAAPPFIGLLNLTSPSATALNLTVNKCVFFGGESLLSITGGNVADSTSITNSIFMNSRLGLGNTNIQINVFNCSFIGMRSSAAISNTGGSASFLSTVTNCLIWGCVYGIYSDTANRVTQTYNRFIGNSVNLNAVATSATSTTTFSHGLILPYYLQNGLGTFQMFSSVFGGPNTSYGTATGAPATDMYGVAWTGTSPDAGSATYRNLSSVSPYVPTERNASTITIAPGSTSQSIELYLGVTGLTSSSSGLSARYNRTRTASVSIPLVARTIAQAWTSGGFAEVDATNMPGIYRLDVPDAALAAGADDVTVVVRGASGTNGAVMTIKLSSGGLTSAQTASAVWGADPTSYVAETAFGGVVNATRSVAGSTEILAQNTPSAVWDELTTNHTTHGTFGYNSLRSDQASKQGLVTLSSAGNVNRVDADVHAIANDIDAATELKGALLHNGVDYISANMLNASAGSPSIGPYTVLPSGAGADNIVDLNVGTASPLVLNLQDGSGAPFNASGATITATVYTAGGSTVTTYTGSIIAGYIGAISVPLDTVTTSASATYTMLVSVVIGTTTTVFGPLKLVVRAI